MEHGGYLTYTLLKVRDSKITETFMNLTAREKLKPIMGKLFHPDYLWSSSLSVNIRIFFWITKPLLDFLRS